MAKSTGKTLPNGAKNTSPQELMRGSFNKGVPLSALQKVAVGTPAPQKKS